MEEDPEEERLELELFYQLKGLTPDQATSMAERLQAEPKQFLRALMHEELGLSEESFPNPLRSTISATISTASAWRWRGTGRPRTNWPAEGSWLKAYGLQG
jgi:hypothetical protein